MPRIPVSLALLAVLGAAFCGPALATQAGTPPKAATAAQAVVGTSLAQPPQSANDAREAIDGAVAGVLVGALTEQFGRRAVSIKLDKLSVLPSSIRDRVVKGEGRLQIEGDADWVGFRFTTLYDTTLGSASYPAITLGGVASGEREVPNDTVLVRQLDDNVVARLGKEFANQNVRLQLDHISTVEAGTRYLRISASGIADFGREGSTPAQVEALYDRRDNAWLRVNYELGPNANREQAGILAGS